jgi:hypothetical protein
MTAWRLPFPETAELVAVVIGGGIAVFSAGLVLMVLWVVISVIVLRK